MDFNNFLEISEATVSSRKSVNACTIKQLKVSPIPILFITTTRYVEFDDVKPENTNAVTMALTIEVGMEIPRIPKGKVFPSIHRVLP
jgi:hypothetical protein